jgi:hypothetical protein
MTEKPHRFCKTPSECRRACACLDGWHCVGAALAEKQEPLGEDFEKVLYENLWEIYLR